MNGIRPAIAPKTKVEIMDKWHKGIKIPAIAADLGIQTNRVTGIVISERRKAGELPKTSKRRKLKYRRLTAAETEQIIAYRDRGWTFTRIGRKLGTSISTAAKTCNDAKKGTKIAAPKPKVAEARSVDGLLTGLVEVVKSKFVDQIADSYTIEELGEVAQTMNTFFKRLLKN